MGYMIEVGIGAEARAGARSGLSMTGKVTGGMMLTPGWWVRPTPALQPFGGPGMQTKVDRDSVIKVQFDKGQVSWPLSLWE